MDCEKFESALMDELYGELDELTSAAAKRHVAGCARCTALLGGLRATRRVAAVPLVEPPADLEERILLAVREAQKVVPLRRRAGGVLSMAGTWAMRPQTAMAALFLVMIGTSVLLIRGKPSRAPSAEVTVTERGAPAPASPAAGEPTVASYGAASAAVVTRPPEAKPVASAVAAADLPSEDGRGAATKGWAPAKEKDDESLGGMANASAPAGAPNALPQAPPAAGFGGGAAGPGAVAQNQQPAKSLSDGLASGGDKQAPASPFDTALQSYRAGRFDDATRSFDSLATSDANADLWAARSVRESKGCRNALARFDKVARRAAGSATGWDALLEGALCYRAIGDFGQARVRLTELLKVDSHKDRAQAELDRINQLQQAQGNTTPPAAAARPSPKRAAPAATAVPNAAVDSAF
ncbi:MAG TPA: zf-HC2 domain-containing protein [Polyangiaceae bacterium]